MNCGNGALQTRGTCWFFSIINGFLMSDAGQKILFNSLEKFYKGLSQEEKAYFDDGIDAPCPLRGDIIKTKRIYFYKFLDQYLCFRSGPRSVSAKMGRSAKILGGASLAGTIAKQHGGGKGAYVGEELPKILKHLGLTDYLLADETGSLRAEDNLKRPHFVIAKYEGRSVMENLPKFRPGSYSPMCCSITIGNTKANEVAHSYHAITGFMCNGKGYLFDSNQRKTFPCNWLDRSKLRKVVVKEIGNFYRHFAGGQIDYIGYNFVIFSKNEYINSIKPSCRLRYKKTKTPSSWNEKNFERYNPAQIAAIKIAKARPNNEPFLGQNTYDYILKTAKNEASGIQRTKNLKNAGYRINREKQAKFLIELGKKFRGSVNKFANAKNEMKKATFKYQKAAIYSRVYKNFPAHQRKILAHFRDKGVWLNNASPNSPAPTPRTTRKKEIETKFNAYWKQLTKNNRATVRNYIDRHKSPSPMKPKSPSPPPNLQNVLSRINSTKTAVARKSILKNVRGKIGASNYKILLKKVKDKNQNNRNARETKKFKMVAH